MSINFVSLLKMQHSFLHILDEIGFDDSEKKVYFSLVKLGQGTVRDIYNSCDLPRTTIQSVLERLFEKGYVVKHFQDGLTKYWVDGVEWIEKDLYKKISLTQDLDSYIRQIYKTNSNIPWVKVYDKKTNIRNLIEWFGQNVPRWGDIYTIDSPWSRNYLSFFTQEEFEEIMKKKKKRDIITHSLIPYWAFKIIPIQTLKSQAIIIRQMPKNIDFKASVWLIEGKIVFFSGETNLVVEITNPIIYMSMKSVYDFISTESKEIFRNL